MEFDLDKIQVFKDRVLIEITERPETKIGSIFVPDSVQTKQVKGRVLLFTGVIHKLGEECDKDLKVGQEVIFNVLGSGSYDDYFAVCRSEDIFLITKHIKEKKKDV